MVNKVWVYKNVDTNKSKELMSKYGLSEICASVLQNRLNIVGGNVDNMFKRVIYNLHNPYLLNDMDKAVLRIKTAINKNEKITIIGDYDADGITSTSILYMFLKDCNANVNYSLPSRFNGGYGMNTKMLDKISAAGTKLIITVDNGISSHNEIAYAKKIGVDVIVTDHHECPDVLPECEAVINPKRKDSTYPFSELAGVGVTFKLICALTDSTLENMIKKYILITAIGTIGDIVPICDENRAIVIMGLKMIPYNKNEGLKFLFNIMDKKEIEISDISFGLVPKLNAAGRLEDASVCVKMLTTT
ncbi:MAG: DHH family phosphoesterase, partial [Clostridia bacterium]|nr:DHH family phosphoesterase [Clostridia bacterium]